MNLELLKNNKPMLKCNFCYSIINYGEQNEHFVNSKGLCKGFKPILIPIVIDNNNTLQGKYEGDLQ